MVTDTLDTLSSHSSNRQQYLHKMGQALGTIDTEHGDPGQMIDPIVGSFTQRNVLGKVRKRLVHCRVDRKLIQATST